MLSKSQENDISNYVTPKPPCSHPNKRLSSLSSSVLSSSTSSSISSSRSSISITSNKSLSSVCATPVFPSSSNPSDQRDILSVIQTVIQTNRRPEAINKGVKRKVISKDGGCLTSDECMAILKEQDDAKRAKIETTEENKRISLENKKKREEEAMLKKETKAEEKKKKEAESRKIAEQKAIKKANKASKQCHKCNAKLKNDKQHGNRWLMCFDCNSWCCYKCLPKSLKGACINDVYRCDSCKKE